MTTSLLTLLLLGSLVACGGEDGPREITGRRVVTQPPRIPPMAPFDDTVRFGMGMPSAPASHAPAKPTTIAWDLPDGWSEVPAGPRRIATFRIDDRSAVDVSLTTAGGGLAANVNRWARQIGHGSLSPVEIAALPTESVLGVAAHRVEFEGTWAGMGQAERKAGYRLLGLVVPMGGTSIFLKMIGPVDDVAAGAESFLDLARSLRLEQPAAGGILDPGPQVDLGNLEWTVPEGWVPVEGDRPLRIATFRPGGREDLECYISVLGLTGGGVLQNLTFWLGQVGKPGITPEAATKLPRVEVLGRACPLLEAEGSYRSKEEGAEPVRAALLGVPIVMPQQSLFVKMTGPPEAVKAERAAFVRFVESLR